MAGEPKKRFRQTYLNWGRAGSEAVRGEGEASPSSAPVTPAPEGTLYAPRPGDVVTATTSLGNMAGLRDTELVRFFAAELKKFWKDCCAWPRLREGDGCIVCIGCGEVIWGPPAQGESSVAWNVGPHDADAVLADPQEQEQKQEEEGGQGSGSGLTCATHAADPSGKRSFPVSGHTDAAALTTTTALDPSSGFSPNEVALLQEMGCGKYITLGVPTSKSEHLSHCHPYSYKGFNAKGCLVQHKFHLFTKLPPELRGRIYEHALASNRPIRPHLCNKQLKFHDDNQDHHNAINALLGITRVSKKVRDEALPAFYAANTFVVDKDTPAYLDHLEHLGRFHMIRQVQFEIVHRREVRSAEILRGMNQYLKAAEVFERTHRTQLDEAAGREGFWSEFTIFEDQTDTPSMTNPPISIAALIGADLETLKAHPQHLFSGLPEYSVPLVLRKLTSTFPSPLHPQKLVMPIPRAAILTDYASLKWFAAVAHGLGIHLHFVEGVPLDYVANGALGVTWRQKWQKKDFDLAAGTTASSSSSSLVADAESATISAEEVKQRALDMFPELADMPHARNVYYRTGCRKSGITWFHVPVDDAL